MKIRQPSKSEFWRYFSKSISAQRLANGGPCYLEAQKRIEALTSYNCLVSNATVGLELALRARLRPGSRVLIPSFTFKATYLAVRNAGMVPVVTCVDEATWVLTPSSILASKCDAAIVVSPFGHSINFGDYDCLNLPIFYDLAGAWGLFYKGPNVAVYSFHATKNIPVGEGGAVVSSDAFLIQEIFQLSNFRLTNAKLSELSCAMLLALLDKPLIGGNPYKSTFDTCALPSKFCSLAVACFDEKYHYAITTNKTFQAKKYYYPLIEDAYKCEILERTSLDHKTRKTVALPRNICSKEFKLICSELYELGIYF